MILIGSKAIKYHFPDFPREPKDEDYAVHDLMPKIKGTEFLIMEGVWDYVTMFDDVLEPNLLYSLKMSHLFWDINWDKHLFDVQFLKKKGCVLNKKFFYRMYAYWNTLHGENKRSDLNMSADDFFNNALNTPHDFYHTLINPKPTYLKVLKDGADVDVCEDKFDALAFEEKCNLVREEVYIMAFERFKNLDYRIAYSKMLKKFIMNHAPMWEAIFIIENYITLHKPIFNYIKLLNDELQRNHCGITEAGIIG